MTISELITKLVEFKALHGDTNVVFSQDDAPDEFTEATDFELDYLVSEPPSKSDPVLVVWHKAPEAP